MKELPHKVQNGHRPMFEGDTFRFECRPELKCFTRCCRNADMYLYPYDIIRLKNRLEVSSNRLLEQHTYTAFRDNPYFPSVMLKMSDTEDKACPFLTDEGCAIYEDRPISCRTYPLERAVARGGTNADRMDCYFIARHSYCLGHNELRKWTVEDWIEDQQIREYNEMNNLWVEIDTIFRNKPWGEQAISNPALKMSFMACFNLDRFKDFVQESTFLSRFKVTPTKLEQIMNSDVELMKFGFDWIKFFLTGKGPLEQKGREQSF
jgi:Fe-S-cluster containining protein